MQKRRKKFEEQLKFSYLIRNKLGKELEAMSKIIEANSDILDSIHKDLIAYRDNTMGRKGLNADQVFRSVILKQYHGLSYDDLEFHPSDPFTFRAFARIEHNQFPKKSALQSNIKSISASSWDKINRILVDYSRQQNIEKANLVRTDASDVETNIHRPTDSTLLQDGIRVITRTLARAKELKPSPDITFSNHNRAAKKKVLTILNCKQKKRNKAYKDLLSLASKVKGYAQQAIPVLLSNESPDVQDAVMAQIYADQLEHNLGLLKQVIDQTIRRVIHDEKVPANEKVTSFLNATATLLKRATVKPSSAIRSS